MEVNDLIKESISEVVAAKPKGLKSPQISLTFKRNSNLEMDLYDHLQKKFYQGAYIKEVLINDMMRERPDLAKKYNMVIPKKQTKELEVFEEVEMDLEEDEEIIVDTESTEEVGIQELEIKPSGDLTGGLLATLSEFGLGGI